MYRPRSVVSRRRRVPRGAQLFVRRSRPEPDPYRPRRSKSNASSTCDQLCLLVYAPQVQVSKVRWAASVAALPDPAQAWLELQRLPPAAPRQLPLVLHHLLPHVVSQPQTRPSTSRPSVRTSRLELVLCPLRRNRLNGGTIAGLAARPLCVRPVSGLMKALRVSPLPVLPALLLWALRALPLSRVRVSPPEPTRDGRIGRGISMNRRQFTLAGAARTLLAGTKRPNSRR